MPDSTITIARAERGWRLTAEQWLPQPIAAVFAFFSDAFNLEVITPNWLHFEVLTPAPIALGEGTLIDYRLRVRGLPLRWQSLITSWDPPHRFADVMQRGPYRWWRHTHAFETRSGGTLTRDEVDYGVPGGALVHRLVVGPDVRRIFAFRQRRLAELFAAGRQPG